MSEQAPHPRTTIRDLAVRQVDNEHGYTAEYATDPSHHRYLYDRREEHLREAVSLVEALSGQAPSPLKTQLADAIVSVREDAVTRSGREQSYWRTPHEEAEALVPLVERLISEAERRTLTRAATRIRALDTHTFRGGGNEKLASGFKTEALAVLARLMAAREAP